MADTAVVILNYNGLDFLQKFLGGVVENSPNADIIVADNCSTDDSVNYLKAAHPEVQLILFDKNYGFTGGYNRAIETLSHTYCVLLNSDIEVTNNWLPPLKEFMRSNDAVAACQPKIRAYHDRSSFEYAGAAGGFLDAFGFPYCRGRIFDSLETDTGQYDELKQVFWATGACMMVRVKDYLDAGGLDEDFFAHMEEIDLCWRFHLMNKNVYCIPSSLVYHVGGGTLSKNNPRKTYYNFRNNLTMLFKNEPWSSLIWKLPIKLSLDWLAAFKFLTGNSYQHCFAVIKGHYQVLLNLSAILIKRKHVSSLKKVELGSRHPKSIVWNFYIQGKKKYSEL